MKVSPNTRLKGVRERNPERQALMMVHVPKGDIDTVTAMVKKHHPETNVKRVERGLPAFP